MKAAEVPPILPYILGRLQEAYENLPSDKGVYIGLVIRRLELSFTCRPSDGLGVRGSICSGTPYTGNAERCHSSVTTARSTFQD